MAVPVSTRDTRPLALGGRARLLARVWLTALIVVVELRRRPMPEVVARLSAPANTGRRHGVPMRPVSLLSRAVSRGLRLGPWEPRCLIRALVLYRLLRAQGDAPTLVIGLPPASAVPDAHAWVELGGQDVGPLPGGAGHAELVRYPTGPTEANGDHGGPSPDEVPR